MTDAEKIAQLEQKIADQDQRLVAQDQRLIAIEKNGAVSGEQGKQNAKEILRVERQTTDQFKQLVNLMNEGFVRVEERINRVETNLKNDIIRVETNLKNDINRMEERINRVEGQMIKWLTLIVGVAVIIIGALTYLKG